VTCKKRMPTQKAAWQMQATGAYMHRGWKMGGWEEKEAYAYTRGIGCEPQNTKRQIPQSLSCTECASPTNPHSDTCMG
jgi:hypothetical protein